MPRIYIAGSLKPTFQGNVFTYNPRTGVQVQSVWRGPLKNALRLSGNFQLAGWAHSYSESAGVGEIRLEGNAPLNAGAAAEIPVDNWQLVGNDLQKDIYEHPNSLKIEAAKVGSLGSIRNDINLYNQGLPPGTFQYDPSVQGLVNQLVALLLRGTTHYPISRLTLRHTQTVSDSYAGGGFNNANINTIYTTNQLLFECAQFPKPLPAPEIALIGAIPAEAAAGYLWGWKKSTPTDTSLAQFKVEIATEFSLDLWSTYVYPASTAPDH